MKNQLKRILPFFIIGITSISYGKNISNVNTLNKIQVNIEYMRGFSKNHDYKNISANQSVIMPAFRWTGDSGVNASFWNGITDIGGGLIPYVAFGSYVGTSWRTQQLVQRDADAKQIQQNNQAGIKSIGYTYTVNSTRDLNEVYADIDNFVNFYGRENISGYFVDEVMGGATQNQIEYMANIYNYIKTKYPEMLVIANNGWGIRDGIAPYADIWLTREVTADEYLNHYREPTSEFEKNPENASHIYHVIHSASPEQYEEILRLSRERNAGRVFITSDTNAYPSGYDDLPTYFEDLMLTINNFTPKSNSLFSSDSRASDKVTIEMPRSKVDLDLTKTLRNISYKNLENTKDGEYKIDIAYMQNYGGEYKDKESNVKYKSDSDGILLNTSKDFGKLTLGIAFGSQKSNVNYKEKYGGVKEKITSYEFGLNGKYDFNENIDLATNLIYSTNKHKFNTSNGLGAINGVNYKSKILDFNTRLGYKFLFDNGYVKPYIGLGITRVKEEDIDKLKFSDTSKTALNGSLGVYGEKSFGKFYLFGDLEYEHRFSNKSYHGVRTYSTRYEIAGLDYKKGVVNFELGLRYNITDNFKINVAYQLSENKNNLMKFGFGFEF